MTNDKLSELLSGEEPEEKTDRERKEFKPKFNVREEFALWAREQFPELKEYAKKKKAYESLEARREEVYQAALGAVNHGVSSTEACATSRLRYGWDKLEKGFGEIADPKMRAKSLEAFVDSLENLSISLGGNQHFTQSGRFLNGSPYGSYGNLNAFVYRVGEEAGKDTKYLVFDKPQKFNGTSNVILIGEFTQLTKWNYDKLQKIASDFKGPELTFIEKVDKDVPEEGVYIDSAYRSSRVRSVGS